MNVAIRPGSGHSCHLRAKTRPALLRPVEQKGYQHDEKNLVAALGFVGLLAAGTAGGSVPPRRAMLRSVEQLVPPVCGPWNGGAPDIPHPGYGFKLATATETSGGYGGGYAYRHGQHGNWNGNRGDGHYDRDD